MMDLPPNAASETPPHTPPGLLITPSTAHEERGTGEKQQQQKQQQPQQQQQYRRKSQVDPSPPPRLSLGGALRRTIGRDTSASQLEAKASRSTHGGASGGISTLGVQQRKLKAESLPKGFGTSTRPGMDTSSISRTAFGDNQTVSSPSPLSSAAGALDGRSSDERVAPQNGFSVTCGGDSSVRRLDRSPASYGKRVETEGVQFQQQTAPLSSKNRPRPERTQADTNTNNNNSNIRTRSTRGGPKTSQDGNGRRGMRNAQPGSVSRPSSAASTTSAGRKNPLQRYLVLSGALVVSGLAIRYLWRQLAGLAGGLLILAAARRCTAGKADADEDSFSTARRQKRRKSGQEPGPSSFVANASSSTTELVTNISLEGQAEALGVPRTAGVGAGLGAEDRERRQHLDFGGAFADSSEELRQYWLDGGPQCPFSVRGANYMADKRKIPAGPAAMRLVHVDLFSVDEPTFHLASKGRCRDQIAAFVKSFEEKGETVPFLFLLNIIVPGTPIVSTVMYWALVEERNGGDTHMKFLEMLGRYAEVPGSGYKKLDRTRSPPLHAAADCPSQSQFSPVSTFPATTSNSASDTSLAGGACPVEIAGGSNVEASRGISATREQVRSDLVADESGSTTGTFGVSDAVSLGAGSASALVGDGGDIRGVGDEGLLPADDFRNERFKLIPSIVDGPFIVRRAVGNKPALLGRKLRQRYFRGADYVETDVDVGSSMVAEKIVALCRGYARSLTVELGVCLEGRCEEELPERCIGVVRLVNLDLDRAEALELPMSPSRRSAPVSSSVEGGNTNSPPTTSDISRGNQVRIARIQQVVDPSPSHGKPEQVVPAAGGARRAAVTTNA